MKKLLVMGMLVMVMSTAAPADARWYSQWSVHCDFNGDSNEVESVTFAAWDDSHKNQNLWRPLPTRPPTWKITATKEELAEMNLTIRGERSTRFLGLTSTCEVIANKTGEKLSFDEAWIVFGDIQSKHRAAAEEREAARSQAIRESLGLPQEGVEAP